MRHTLSRAQAQPQVADHSGANKLGKRFATAHRTALQPGPGLIVQTDGDCRHRSKPFVVRITVRDKKGHVNERHFIELFAENAAPARLAKIPDYTRSSRFGISVRPFKFTGFSIATPMI